MGCVTAVKYWWSNKIGQNKVEIIVRRKWKLCKDYGDELIIDDPMQ